MWPISLSERRVSDNIVKARLTFVQPCFTLLTMKTTTTENENLVGTTVHAFELAGLGRAPFKYVRMEVKLHQAPGEVARAGSTCDYCGTAITNCFWLRSADGREFKVGCDCIAKADDAGLMRRISRVKADHERALRARRDEKRKDEIVEMLADRTVREKLESLPHPRGFKNRETGEALTLFHWASWMLAHAGAKGRREVAKKIEEVSK